MKVINIHEAKAKLSEYVDAAAAGERVLICKRNQPVAELRAVPAARLQPRPVGRAAGKVSLDASFFEPLSDDFLDAFAGGVRAERESRPSRVAEPRPEYRARPGRRGGK